MIALIDYIQRPLDSSNPFNTHHKHTHTHNPTVGTSNEIYSHMERDNHWFQGAELESFHRTRRIDAVAQYLRGLNEETRRRVLEACLPRTLQDVGIKAEDLQL